MSQYNIEPFAFEGSLLTTNYHTTNFNDAFSKSTITLDVSVRNGSIHALAIARRLSILCIIL